MIALQFLFNALSAAAIISLVAMGFSLIYATNRFVHFAHGAVTTLGGYILYLLVTNTGLPLILAAVISILGTGIAGVILYEIIYEPLRKKGASSAVLMIASLALMILLENIYTAFTIGKVKSIGVASAGDVALRIGDATLSSIQAWSIVLSVVTGVAVIYAIKKTSLGKKIKAVTDNPELATITGIAVKKIHRIGFFLGSALAGLAGVLISIDQNVSPLMGTDLIIDGFAASVIGGIFSPLGAMIGGLVVGLSKHFGVLWLSSSYQEAIVFVLLVVFLLFRPEGLFGLYKGVRK